MQILTHNAIERPINDKPIGPPKVIEVDDLEYKVYDDPPDYAVVPVPCHMGNLRFNRSIKTKDLEEGIRKHVRSCDGTEK
jgi:hypothetical protein